MCDLSPGCLDVAAEHRMPCCCALVQGFLAGASAEIFGAGPILGQLSKYPQPVLVVLALIIAGAHFTLTAHLQG